MLATLLQTLTLASSGFLSFGSMTIVILLLLSKGGWRNGLAYWLGYTSAYATWGTAIVLLNTRLTATGAQQDSPWLNLLLIFLGLLLIFLSRRSARRPHTPTDQPPRFFALLDDINPAKAFGIGALVTVLNIKNLALFLSALSVVMLSRLSPAQKIIVTLLAVLVFCAAVSLPLLIYAFFPGRAAELLNTIKTTIERHSRPLSIWAPLVFGILILLKGITALP